MSDRENALERGRRDDTAALKYEYLYSLLRNQYIYTGDKSVHDRLRELGFCIDVSQPYMVILVSAVGDCTVGCDMPSHKLWLCALSNGVLGSNVPFEVIEMDERMIAVVANVISDDPSINQELIAKVVEEYTQTAAKFIGAQISVVVGKPRTDFALLQEAFADVLSLLRYETVDNGVSRVIFENSISRTNGNGQYPMKIEKQLIHAIQTLDFLAARKKYDELVDVIRCNDFDVFYSFVTHLAFEFIFVIKRFDISESSGGLYEGVEYEYSAFINKIAECWTLEQINNAFYKALSDIETSLESMRANKYYELIDAIKSEIRANYADPDMSVNTLAQKYGFSPAYLGQKFLKYTSRSIVDYINETRSEFSKEMLSKTTISVSEVARLNGFSSTQYFHRVFKQRCGMTPSEYRRQANSLPQQNPERND